LLRWTCEKAEMDLRKHRGLVIVAASALHILTIGYTRESPWLCMRVKKRRKGAHYTRKFLWLYLEVILGHITDP
jgi:hypothetical protein